MDPLTFAAIMGGSQLLGGMMGGAAARQKAVQEAQAGAIAQAQKGLQESISRQEQQQQASLGSLIDAYRSALMGG